MSSGPGSCFECSFFLFFHGWISWDVSPQSLRSQLHPWQRCDRNQQGNELNRFLKTGADKCLAQLRRGFPATAAERWTANTDVRLSNRKEEERFRVVNTRVPAGVPHEFLYIWKIKLQYFPRLLLKNKLLSLLMFRVLQPKVSTQQWSCLKLK